MLLVPARCSWHVSPVTAPAAQVAVVNRYEALQVQPRRWARLLAVQGSKVPGRTQASEAKHLLYLVFVNSTGLVGDATLGVVWDSAIMKSLCA